MRKKEKEMTRFLYAIAVRSLMYVIIPPHICFVAGLGFSVISRVRLDMLIRTHLRESCVIFVEQRCACSVFKQKKHVCVVILMATGVMI